MSPAAPPSTTVTAYIATFPPPVRKLLQQLRKAIRAAVPGATEAIKYGMPTYVLGGNLVSFGAHKEHIGLYPAPRSDPRFKAELARHGGAKSSVSFPLDQPLPLDLIRRIVLQRVATLQAKAAPAAPPPATRATRVKAAKVAGGGFDLDGYLSALSAPARASIQQLRKAIRAAAPAATEGTSYGLPAFHHGGKPLACYAAAAKHCSFYPMSGAVIEAHAADLRGFGTSKGTVRFAPGATLPPALVRKLVRARMTEIAGAEKRAAGRTGGKGGGLKGARNT